MARGFTATFDIEDADGDKTRLTLGFSDTQIEVDISGYVYQFAQLLDTVIDGHIFKMAYHVHVEKPEPLKDTPENNCDIQHGAQFLFHAGRYPVRIRIPTLKKSLYLAGSKAVDVADSDVAAMIDAIVDGLTVDVIPVEPTDSRGADIDSFFTATENFRP